MGSWSREMSRGRGVILGRGLHVIRGNGRLHFYLLVQSAKKKLACKQAVPPHSPGNPGRACLQATKKLNTGGYLNYFNSDDIRRSTSEVLNLGYKLDFGRFLGQPFNINVHPN